MKNDLHNNVRFVKAFESVTINTVTTTVGEILDTSGFESIEFNLNSTVLGGGEFAPLLEEGNDPALADAAPIAADFLLGTAAEATITTADDHTRRIGATSDKRYMRLSIVSTGAANAIISATAVFSSAHIAPTDNP